jgi:hypothetical protein
MTTREQTSMSGTVIESLKDFPDNVVAFMCHGI